MKVYLLTVLDLVVNKKDILVFSQENDALLFACAEIQNIIVLLKNKLFCKEYAVKINNLLKEQKYLEAISFWNERQSEFSFTLIEAKINGSDGNKPIIHSDQWFEDNFVDEPEYVLETDEQGNEMYLEVKSETKYTVH